MNEEYDVIVLGTGLTVSAEFRAAAEDLGGACRPGAREAGAGGGPHAPSSVRARPRPAPQRVSSWKVFCRLFGCFWRGVGKGRWAGCEGLFPRRLGLRPHGARWVVIGWVVSNRERQDQEMQNPVKSVTYWTVATK